MRADVLLVEIANDSALTAAQVEAALQPAEGKVHVVHSRSAFATAMAAQPWTVVIAAVEGAEIPAARVHTWLRGGGARTPVLVLCTRETLPAALALRPRDISDIVLRDEPWRLAFALSRALCEAAVTRAPGPVAEALERLPDAAVLVDSRGRIQWLNAATSELYALPPGTGIGLDVRMLLASDPPGGAPGPVDTLARRPDGTAVPIEVTSRDLPDGSRLVLLRDVTALRAVERRLQEAQGRSGMIDVACGVAHRLNNILTGVLTYASLVRRDLGPEHVLDADVAEIEGGAGRAASLARQLLLLARRRPGVRKRVEPNELLAEACEFLRQVVGEHIEFEVLPGEGLPPIYAEPSQVEQVLTNLVVNAQDALPNGGRIVVSTSMVTEREARSAVLPVRPGRYVVYEVRDNGLGMDPEALEFALHPTQSAPDDAQGSGLGLTVVAGLLREHGGYLELDTSAGVGTSVRVAFPVAHGEEEELAGVILDGPEVILVAEDDPGVRAVVERILTAHRYRPVMAADGQEALELFQADPDQFDAAVLDVLMPRLGGLDLYDALTATRPDFRVLWVSGYAEGQQVVLGPTTDFLPKPFRPVDLIRHLRALLDRP